MTMPHWAKQDMQTENIQPNSFKINFREITGYMIQKHRSIYTKCVFPQKPWIETTIPTTVCAIILF